MSLRSRLTALVCCGVVAFSVPAVAEDLATDTLSNLTHGPAITDFTVTRSLDSTGRDYRYRLTLADALPLAADADCLLANLSNGTLLAVACTALTSGPGVTLPSSGEWQLSGPSDLAATFTFTRPSTKPATTPPPPSRCALKTARVTRTNQGVLLTATDNGACGAGRWLVAWSYRNSPSLIPHAGSGLLRISSITRQPLSITPAMRHLQIKVLFRPTVGSDPSAAMRSFTLP